jgi:hypothetical protein
MCLRLGGSSIRTLNFCVEECEFEETMVLSNREYLHSIDWHLHLKRWLGIIV